MSVPRAVMEARQEKHGSQEHKGVVAMIVNPVAVTGAAFRRLPWSGGVVSASWCDGTTAPVSGGRRRR